MECISPALAAAQSLQQYAVRVNGNPIVSARPAARVAGEWFVPLEQVARALGASLTIDPSGQSLRVLRSDGVTTSYDSATGRILQGFVLAGEVASFRQIQLRVGAENLLFPLSGVVALLGVTAREDPDHAVLEIDSLSQSGAVSAGAGPSFQIATLDHRYSFVTNGQIWQQSLNLRGEALMDDFRLTGSLDLSRALGGSILGFRQGSIRLRMPSQRAFTAGDQGTYIGLDALSNTVRGLGFEWRWGRFIGEVYGGGAASSTSAALGSSGVANYDTTLTGFGFRRKSKSADLSLAGNLFRGPRRNGMTIGAGLSGRYAGNEFRLQGLFGSFSGFSLRPVLVSVENALLPLPAMPFGPIVELERETERVKGAGYGFSLSDTFTPFKSNKLLFTGVWDFYSRNFLVAREESRFSAVSRKSLSVSLRPIRYIGVTGSVKETTARLGSRDLDRGYTYGVNVTAPGSTPIQAGYFRSLQMSGGSGGSRFELSQYSLQLPRLSRYSASATYTEVRFDGHLERSLNETVSINFVRYGRLGLHDQLQLSNSHSYGPDWTIQLGNRGAAITAGLERQTARGQRAFLAPVAAVNLPLPRGLSLRFSYLSMRGSRLVQIEIGGPIIRRREVVNVNNQSALIVNSSLTGKVYRDVDLDGKFSPGTDQPIPQLKVTLDEDTVTSTDAAGYFRFDGLSPGPHRVRAEIATLPANFIFINQDLLVAIMPYRANLLDFVAIPTGQIQGMVFLATLNETGTELARPFPDARIIATGDRDTFSEGDGAFVVGDLPPGTYQLRLDPATVPAGFAPRPAIQTVQVKPGQRVTGVVLSMVRVVVIRPAPAMAPDKPPQSGAAPTREMTGINRLPEDAVVVGAGHQPAAVPATSPIETSKGTGAPPPTASTSLTGSSTTALQLHSRGRQLVQSGDFAGAVAVLTQAIEANPDYALAYNARGYALLRMRKYAQSVADFSEAIRLNPTYSNAYENRKAAMRAVLH